MATRHYSQQPATIGTTRKNPFTGDQLRGERNQFGEPMGSVDPMHAPHDWSGFEQAFPKATPIARSPMAPTPRPTGVGPALRSGGLKTGTLSTVPSPFPMPFGLPSSTMMATPKPAASPASLPAASPGAFPAIGETKSTATGLQSFQPSSGGGRWVGTTSPSMVPRQTNSGVVTNTGATPFDERGMQSADLGGPERARVYDPQQDMSKTFLDASGNVTTPRVGTFPGGPALPPGANGTPSARGVMINPKYQTPGASPIGVISGGTVSQNGGQSFPQAAASKPWPGALPSQQSAAPSAAPVGGRPGFGDLHVFESGLTPNAPTPAKAGFGDLHTAESREMPGSFPSVNPPPDQATPLIASLNRGASIRMARDAGGVAFPSAPDDEMKRRRMAMVPAGY